MTGRLDRPALYDAARDFLETVAAQDSIFTPGRGIWTPSNLESLRSRVFDNLDLGKDAFETKLKKQVTGAPPEVVQLAGEVVYAWFLKAGLPPLRLTRGVDSIHAA